MDQKLSPEFFIIAVTVTAVAGTGRRAATVMIVPLVTLLALRRSLGRRGLGREATGLICQTRHGKSW